MSDDETNKEEQEDVSNEESPDTKENKAEDSSAKESKSEKPKKANRILLIPYPKFIFMYPTLIVSAIATIVLWIGDYSAVDPSQTVPVVMTGVFLGVMMVNMFIIVFDFPRATSLTLVFIISTIVLGLMMFFLYKPDLVPSLTGIVGKLRPAANTTFFFCITVAMLAMYAAVFISVRFNYWELRNNELLHHHGILSDLKRYPAPNLRVDKEINDIFEYILLGAGRLILHPTTEKRAIVLDNILFVGRREGELTKMLGSIKVKIGNDSGVT